MSDKSIILTALIFGALVLGMFIYAYLAKTNGDEVGLVVLQNLT